MSSLLFIYKFYKKSYFTIANLYIRYALLSKFQRIIIIYIINILFIIFIQNLYKRFNKKKLIIFILSKINDFSFNYQKSHFECLNSIVKITLFIIIKSNN